MNDGGHLQSFAELPVVAGLSHVCRAMAAAGRIHKVIHNDPHDRSRPLKLSAEDTVATVDRLFLFSSLLDNRAVKRHYYLQIKQWKPSEIRIQQVSN